MSENPDGLKDKNWITDQLISNNGSINYCVRWNTAYTSTAARQGQRRGGYAVGANYRLAPGFDLVAEYVRHTIHERGVDSDAVGNNGVQSKVRANVFLVGTRLAF